MATKKVLVEIEVKQSGGKIPKIGKEIDGLTSAQKKYNNALQDNIDAHSEYSKSTQKMKKESAETRRQMTLEEANVIKLTKAQERLAFEQSDLGKEYAKTNIQARLQKLSNQELAIEQIKLAESTEHATDKMQQFKTTAGLSGAIVTEFGRTISDLPYGIRGIGNNVSQLATLFGLFSQNVEKAGGTMKDGFRLLFDQMKGAIGIMTALQIVVAGFQSGVIQDFIARIMEGSKALIGLKKSLSDVKDEFGGLTAELDVYTHILESSTRSVKEKEDAYAKIIDKFPELEDSIKRVGDEFIVSADAVDDMKTKLEELALSSAALNRLSELSSEKLEDELKDRVAINEAIKDSGKLKKESFQNVSDEDLEKIKEYSDIINNDTDDEGFVITQQQREEALTKLNDIYDKSREAERKRLIQSLGESRGYEKNVESLEKYIESLEDVSEAKRDLMITQGSFNKENQAEIDALKEYVKVSGKDEDKTPRSGKSVSVFKANLLDLAKLEERFRQESKKSEIKTDEELIKEKAKFAKDDLDITIKSFIEKEKLRLKEFIDKQELKKKEKNADVNLINQSIANAKIKTSQSIKLAKQEADGVIEQIERVEGAELSLLARKEGEQARIEIETAETIKRTTVDELEQQQQASIASDQVNEVDKVLAQQKLDNILYDNKKASLERELRLVKGRADEEARINKELMLLKQENGFKEERNEELVQQAKLSLANRGASAIADILGKETAAGKTVAATMATINTYQAVSNALKYGTAPFKYIDAGITAAQGFAQVKNILSTNSPNTGTASSKGATTVKPPDFNIIGSSGVNQLAEAIGSTDDRPIKAYVVSSEVTTQQALDRNTRDSATL